MALHVDHPAGDKPAGEPCPHLGDDDRCRVHADREALGWAACAAYDCGGAGQRVTEALAGTSWRDPTHRRAWVDAYFRARDAQALRAALAGLPGDEAAALAAELATWAGTASPVLARALAFARRARR